MTKRKGSKRPAGGFGWSWVALVAAVAVVAAVAMIKLGESGSGPGVIVPGSSAVSMGPESAPVKVEVFADFQCPACKLGVNTIEHEIRQEFVQTGQVQLVFHNFAFLGSDSTRAAEAAVCAADQNRFWPYHDRLFQEQRGEQSGHYSAVNLKRWAQDLGLDTAAFNDCLDGRRGQGSAKADRDLGQSRGVNSTPTYFVNGTKVVGVPPWTEMRTLIQRSLDAKK